MSLTAWIAVAVVIVTVYCLIKRYETRLVLFTAGLFLLLHFHEADDGSGPVRKEHDNCNSYHGNLRINGVRICRDSHTV